MAGAPAPLPGLGTLGRAHVSARVATGADGRRVLLPPGEAVGLSTRAFDPTDLALALSRRAGAPESAAAGLLREAVDQIEARLAITGDARIDGIGVFQRTSSGVRFAAAPEILAAVNRPFEGLTPVEIARPESAIEPAIEPAMPAPVHTPPPPVPAEPPGAVDILLDLIVNEPTEADTPATDAAEALPADVSPAESAFVDDPLPTAAPASEPDASMPDDGDDDPLAPVDDGIAVPFGTDGESLQDRLPPTETGWHPAPLPDSDDTLPEAGSQHAIEDAEVLADAPEPTLPLEPPPLTDAQPFPDPVERRTEPLEVPERSGRTMWAVLYTLAVIMLSCLIAWWAAMERHPRIVSVRPAMEARGAAPVPSATPPADTLRLPRS